VGDISLDKLKPTSAPTGAQQQQLRRESDLPAKRKGVRRRPDQQEKANDEGAASEHQVDRLA